MKAKTCIKKTLSMIVVLVMLFTMIPVGMISVSADTPTITLSAYESTDEFVIMNTADWVLIAESGLDFKNKVVKLGADIDAGGFKDVLDPERFADLGGANMPPRANGAKPTSGIEKCRDDYAATFPTLFAEFAGEFDGQGYTIKNAKVEEGLIAAITLDGAEIANVNVVNVQCCDFRDYNDYGLVVGVAKGSLVLDNINVVDCSVPANTFNSLHFNGGGGLLGLADTEYKLAAGEEPVDDALLEITNCNIDVDVHTGGEHTAIGANVHGTGAVVGTVNPNFDFEMKNVNITGGNIKTYAFYAGAIGVLHVGEGKYAEIENINISNVNYSANRGAFTWGGITSGALAGAISPRKDATINITKVNVTDSVIGEGTCGVSGGLIGTIHAFDSVNGGNHFTHFAPVVGAEINISNCYVVATVMELDMGAPQPQYGGAGGFIGQIGEGDSTESNSSGNKSLGRLYRGDINIWGCYVGSTVIAGNKVDGVADQYNQGAGGLFAFVSAPTAEIYVSDMIVDVNFPLNQIVEMKDGAPFVADQNAIYSVGLISYAGHTRANYANVAGWETMDAKYQLGEDGFYEVYLHVEDIVTTFQDDIYSVVRLNRKGGIHYNDTDIGFGDKGANTGFTDEAILKVRPAVARQMVQYDENGFIETVFSTLGNASSVQVSEVADGKVDMRFIALAYADQIGDASATIVVSDYATGDVVKTFTFENLELLDGLTAVGAVDAYTTEFGAKKVLAATIQNVPVGERYVFTWSFSCDAAEGNTLEGTLYENGAFINRVVEEEEDDEGWEDWE